MKRVSTHFCLMVFTAIALTTSGMGQAIEIVGTGNPDMDILNVQMAVDQYSAVTLRGHFSFDRLPTQITGLARLATIRVSKSVSISGASGEKGEMATIDGGTIPFYVEAPGASVTIDSVHFDRPIAEAIFVYAVRGLTITNCKIERVVPGDVAGGGSIGIDIDTSGMVPRPTQPGHPENISGRLLIANNDIDMNGESVTDNVLGITIFGVGQSPDKEADIYVSGNKITNVTEPAINLRRVGGRAQVQGNVISTGPFSSQKAPQPEVIRAVNIGSYVIAHNSIDCEWPDPGAKGIGVLSQFGIWEMEHVVVTDNDVTMSPPPGTEFGDQSAGIELRGFVKDSVVSNNRIRGHARAALAIDPFMGGTPANNEFVLNRIEGFQPSGADVFVGNAVPDTLLLGQEGTRVENHGSNTVSVSLERKPGAKE